MENKKQPDKPYNEEEKKIRLLRRLVDTTARALTDAPLSEREACDLIEKTRRGVISLFPDKEGEFELIYRPRFKSLLEENPGVQCDRALRKDPSCTKGDGDTES
jgi:hypothetical protein